MIIKQLRHVMLLVMSLTLFVPQLATAADTSPDPIMVIRFNQDVVHYKKQLQKVMMSVRSVKPTAFLDVVSVVPDHGNKKRNKELRNAASLIAGQIIKNITSTGISPSQIRVTYQNNQQIQDNEVHIFVR